MVLIQFLIFVVVVFVLSGMKIVNEYERGVKFTLGRYAGILQPGLRIVIPVVQSWERVDMRVKAVDVPDQETIASTFEPFSTFFFLTTHGFPIILSNTTAV